MIRIEPESYEDSISAKGVDFTSKTIERLIEKKEKMHKGSLNYNKGHGGRSKSLTILFLYFPCGSLTCRDTRLCGLD